MPSGCNNHASYLFPARLLLTRFLDLTNAMTTPQPHLEPLWTFRIWEKKDLLFQSKPVETIANSSIRHIQRNDYPKAMNNGFVHNSPYEQNTGPYWGSTHQIESTIDHGSYIHSCDDPWNFLECKRYLKTGLFMLLLFGPMVNCQNCLVELNGKISPILLEKNYLQSIDWNLWWHEKTTLHRSSKKTSW